MTSSVKSKSLGERRRALTPRLSRVMPRTPNPRYGKSYAFTLTKRSIALALFALLAFVVPSASALNTLEWMALVRHDVYGELGVSKDASIATINKAYRKLALIHHPDKLAKGLAPSEKKRLTDAFKTIAHAKKVLSDAASRAEYDEAIANLPKWARPKVGKRSIFDKKEVKFPALLVMAMFVSFCVAFISLAQYTSRASDKRTLIESPAFAQSLKKRNKNLPKPRQVSAEVFFQESLAENGMKDLSGWENTLAAQIFMYAKDLALGRLHTRNSAVKDEAAAVLESIPTASESDVTNGSIGENDSDDAPSGKSSSKKGKGKKRRTDELVTVQRSASEIERKQLEKERRIKFEEESKRARELKRREVRLNLIKSKAFVVNATFIEEFTKVGLPFDANDLDGFVLRASKAGENFDSAMDNAEARVKQKRVEMDAREREKLEREIRRREKKNGDESDSDEIVRIARTSEKLL